MTCNQLILLLDIYRGTKTQESIGTRVTDLKFLIDLGFILEESKVLNLITVTEAGQAYVKTCLNLVRKDTVSYHS